MIIVGHEHIMDEDCICPKFVGSKFLQSMVNKVTWPFVRLMHVIIPFTKKDVLSRYASFITNENKTQEANLKELESYYAKGSKFVILTVNMNGMGAGKTKKSFEDQIKEVIKMKLEGHNIFMFYHLDPTVDDCLDLLYKYEKHIDGLKVYTLMGHFPDHINLLKGYEWCQKNKKPVVFHTSPESPVYYKGKKSEIKKRLKQARYPLYEAQKTKRDLCRNFTNPRYYNDILEMFPEVNFDFAHLCGEQEIEKYMNGESSMTHLIITLCKLHKNAYFDTSYSFHGKATQVLLKELLKDSRLCTQILYGTDYYMNKTAASQSDFIDDMIDVIGESNFSKIAIENPSRFHNI